MQCYPHIDNLFVVIDHSVFPIYQLTVNVCRPFNQSVFYLYYHTYI